MLGNATFVSVARHSPNKFVLCARLTKHSVPFPHLNGKKEEEPDTHTSHNGERIPDGSLNGIEERGMLLDIHTRIVGLHIHKTPDFRGGTRSEDFAGYDAVHPTLRLHSSALCQRIHTTKVCHRVNSQIVVQP